MSPYWILLAFVTLVNSLDLPYFEMSPNWRQFESPSGICCLNRSDECLCESISLNFMSGQIGYLAFNTSRYTGHMAQFNTAIFCSVNQTVTIAIKTYSKNISYNINECQFYPNSLYKSLPFIIQEDITIVFIKFELYNPSVSCIFGASDNGMIDHCDEYAGNLVIDVKPTKSPNINSDRQIKFSTYILFVSVIVFCLSIPLFVLILRKCVHNKDYDVIA